MACRSFREPAEDAINPSRCRARGRRVAGDSDRALNNRAGVRSRTREIVFDTAQRLGYISEGRRPAKSIAGVRASLDFVLPMGTNAFIKMLHGQLELQGAARSELAVRVSTIEGFNPDLLARTLYDLSARRKASA